MTQYEDRVSEQKLKNEAEEWGKTINNIHVFNTDNTNMWYDTRKKEGRVIDTCFNSGLIHREISSTGKTVYIGKRAKGETLIDRFRRFGAK